MGNKTKMYVDIMALHQEVTGSCFLCIVKLPDKTTTRFIVDCGIFQEEEHSKYNYEFPFDAEKISFVLATHNHVDHIGRLPMLYKNGFQGKVYCSQQTKIFLPLSLTDSQKVLSDVCKRQHKKQLYGNTDVEITLKNTIGLEYSKKIEITPNISVTLIENGHLIGAAMILVQVNYPGESSINLLFTGDYNSKNDFLFLEDIPEDLKDLQLSVIIESTYGLTSSDQIKYEFNEKIDEAIKDKKTIILPVFSLGRAQEILLKLKKMQNTQKLDKNIPIYFDGKLAHNYTRLYLENEMIISEDKRDFLPENIKYVDCDLRENLLNYDECKIIVTTSGMGTYGPAQVYIPYFISKQKALILFTGYTAEGTFGARLKAAETGEIVNLGGLIAKKFADVSYCTEFSAHAKSDELINLLKKFNNLKAVLINHGSKEAKEKFASSVIEEVDTKSVGILDRNYFFRIDSWGVNKTLSSKFK